MKDDLTLGKTAAAVTFFFKRKNVDSMGSSLYKSAHMNTCAKTYAKGTDASLLVLQYRYYCIDKYRTLIDLHEKVVV